MIFQMIPIYHIGVPKIHIVIVNLFIVNIYDTGQL